jgi:coproporphyrinogen III oxidase
VSSFPSQSPQYDEMVKYVRALQDKITSGVEELERTAPAVPHPSKSWLSSLFSSSSASSVAVPATSTTPATFLHDSWQRPNSLSTGTSCVIANGRVISKGGVNISISQGMLPPHAVKAMRADHASINSLGQGDVAMPYAAASLSLVLHPVNPMGASPCQQAWSWGHLCNAF